MAVQDRRRERGAAGAADRARALLWECPTRRLTASCAGRPGAAASGAARALAVLAAEEYGQLPAPTALAASPQHPPRAEALAEDELDLERARDLGRDVEL